jgi:hypothetical protein
MTAVTRVWQRGNSRVGKSGLTKDRWMASMKAEKKASTTAVCLELRWAVTTVYWKAPMTAAQKASMMVYSTVAS